MVYKRDLKKLSQNIISPRDIPSYIMKEKCIICHNALNNNKELYKCYKCGKISHAICVAKNKRCEYCNSAFRWLGQEEIEKFLEKYII